MKIVFRPFRWILRKDWYSTKRFKKYSIVDVGFLLCLMKKETEKI